MSAHHLDPGIAGLVGALNCIPGLDTMSSCAGHPNPDSKKAQAPEGEWYVNFWLEESEDGWKALNLLAKAKTEVWDGVRLSVWENAGPTCFELKGDGQTPDEMLEALYQESRDELADAINRHRTAEELE